LNRTAWHDLRPLVLAPDPGPAGLAQPVGRSASGGASMLVQLFPFALIFVIFYFLLIAPQRKQQKETEKMLEALKRGDRVVTGGGLHGTVVDFKEADKAVVLEVAPGVKLTFNRSAVASVKREATPPAQAK
jgi:preprotein translocase subunit YajC